jgi:hypothetical protein
MAKQGKQVEGEKVIAFRVSEETFKALERLKRRHAKNWPELVLKAVTKAYGTESEEDAQDCRQVEAELKGELVIKPSEAAATETEESDVSKTLATNEAVTQESNSEELQKLRAPIVTCKGCGGRMTKGTLVVKRAEGYYHPQCAPNGRLGALVTGDVQ